MADDFGFQPITQQQDAPKDDGLGFNPIPKMPDTSDVQKMARDNLAANDNEGATPTQKLDTASGVPISSWIKGGDKETPISPEVREHYIKSVQAGTANDFGDFMQSTLHAIVPIAQGLIHPQQQAEKTVSTIGRVAQAGLEGVGEGYEQGGMFPTPIESNVGTMAGAAANIPYQAFSSAFSGAQRIAQQAGTEAGYPSLGKELALLPEEMMGTEGIFMHPSEGVASKGNTPIDRSNPPSLTSRPIEVNFPNGGPWDTPYADAIKQPIAEATKNPATSLSSPDVDQHIAMATKDKAPPASDFKDVATVTGSNEKTLQVIFKQTGVKPEQVYEEAVRNPEVLDDIRSGNVPDIFPTEHNSSAAPDRLDISPDKATSTFNVVDKDGDHVRGGFDSAEEARQYIEDKKQSEAIESHIQAIESGNGKSQDVFTPESEKAVNQEKPVRNIYAGVEDKVDAMSQEQRDLRLDSLNKKMEAGIITPKELGERESLSAKVHPTELDVAGKQGEQLAAANEGRLKPTAAQKPASEGLFDVSGRGQQDIFAQKAKPQGIIPPSEIGKPTSLRTFLLNNGAKINEANELLSINKNGTRITGEPALEYAHELAKDQGYLPKDEANQPARPITDFQNALADNGGRETTRLADADRVAKAKELMESRKNFDPAKIEHEAYSVGIDTDRIKGEGDKAYIKRLTKALTDFYKNEQGSGSPDALRQMMGTAIKATEGFAGKLTGDFFEKLGDAYIRTFQPELVSDKALRADAFLAKNKAKIQESENAFYRTSEAEMKRWDKATLDEQKEWLYDHETGRWNEEENPDHARMQALYDAMRKSEQDAGVGNQAYKENYLPHQYENPEAVKAFFNSDAMIKKYGKDWFNKASEFKLVQDADRAGFKLKTYNPERMLLDRRQASYNLIAQMDLMKDFESSGLAVKTSAFTLDKKIAKTQSDIAALDKKLTDANAKINDPRQEKWDFAQPAVRNLMQTMAERMESLKNRLEGFNKEKTDNKLTPEQMVALKSGFKIIGPDSKAWNIHPDVTPIWKNAMDMKGLYENQDLAGGAYRSYMAAKAVYVRQKMMASLFHPTHEVVIDLSSYLASAAHHLIQGGKISDLVDKQMIPNIGLNKGHLSNVREFLKSESSTPSSNLKSMDSPGLEAWNTPDEMRTPEQNEMVQRRIEGGFVPTVPKQDIVNFKENFNKAISGLGKNNLRLIGTAMEIPGLPMAPLMEHWIPSMKDESYQQRTDLALARDPSLVTDAGKRSEVFRQIAQDIERNYGEMNRNTQFWNPIVRDLFNATTFSGGWKLAMLQNFRGLAEPAKIAYNWAKTGEFSKEQITHQVLQSYIYTANMMMLGAGLNYLFTGTVGNIKDWINPQTGDKNADGSPIRLRQPAFFNEPIQLMHDIYSDGVVPGTGSFLYHQTLIPGIAGSLLGRDFVGRPYITDPTDLQQWKNMGLDSISPIALGNAEKAEQKGSKTAQIMGWIGFPVAGAYINQTPFEQKIISAYYAMHPSEGGTYQAKLSSEMRGAVATKDIKGIADIEQKMRDEKMSSTQISNAKEQHKTPFPVFAWSKLSADAKRKLIESASDEEKSKYRVK